MDKGRKLSRSEIDKIIKHLRMWPKEHRDTIAPLIQHMYFLETNLVETTAKLQGKLSPAPITPYAELSKKPQTKAVSTSEWLYGLVRDGDAKEITRYTRLRKITPPELLRIVNDWAEKNGKEKV